MWRPTAVLRLRCALVSELTLCREVSVVDEGRRFLPEDAHSGSYRGRDRSAARASIRLFPQPAYNPAVGALLHDVGKLVCEQVPTLFMIGLVLSRGEEDMLTGGKRPCLKLARKVGGLRVGMYTDTAELSAEAALHEPQSV
jgi:hypothetical protein